MAEHSFFMWAPARMVTFASAMNLLKWKKRNGMEPKIRRHDVYTHIRKNKEKFHEAFKKKDPWESAVYEYMDKFVEEGYFIVIKEEVFEGKVEKKYQELTSTPKAEQLYEWLWIAVNLTSKEALGNIVMGAIKDFAELNAQQKENIARSVMSKIEEKRLVGFPFSISKELAKKLLKEAKKQNEK